MAAQGQAIDAFSQFTLTPALGIVGSSVNFTQANLFMVIAGALTIGMLVIGARPRAIVPGRMQALAELAYENLLKMCTDQIGPEGRSYFPFVFTLFFFVLMGNLLGMLPFAFTYTSHIAVTLALAILVLTVVTVVALRIHGLHFFSYFFPPGAPKALAPLIIPVEVISYLSRALSLSVRLVANMVAGHVMLMVFATFVVMLASAGTIGVIGAAAPLALNVLLIGFEFLVAFLQAYVFAILTCIYLHDSVHLH